MRLLLTLWGISCRLQLLRYKINVSATENELKKNHNPQHPCCLGTLLPLFKRFASYTIYRASHFVKSRTSYMNWVQLNSCFCSLLRSYSCSFSIVLHYFSSWGLFITVLYFLLVWKWIVWVIEQEKGTEGKYNIYFFVLVLFYPFLRKS